jgi:hypothetical protein
VEKNHEKLQIMFPEGGGGGKRGPSLMKWLSRFPGNKFLGGKGS